MVGFVTVEADTGYLDQIVVAPECWGDGLAEILLAEARRLSPKQLVLHVNTDNTRAIHFYEKHGFTFAGDDINPVSGRPVYRMRWRP
jgi:putative acetyltransferase